MRDLLNYYSELQERLISPVMANRFDLDFDFQVINIKVKNPFLAKVGSILTNLPMGI